MASPSSSELRGIQIVAPSVLGAGEVFEVGLRLTSDPVPAASAGVWHRHPLSVAGPFNRSPRGIQFLDDVPPTWTGRLSVAEEKGLVGPAHVDFNPELNGIVPGDPRPIRRAGGFRFTRAGTYCLRLRDPETGLEGISNPVRVEAQSPPLRLYWGDLHVHTIFSDALRVPEELYAFARDEAFLDVCALTDHTEALSQTQWRYFTEVTNQFNAPGRFATLVAGEWTSMVHGHRNYYYRGDAGPMFSCRNPQYEKLDDFFAAARAAGALVVPHHSANTQMGVDWSHGHAPDIERLVEIHSVWGNSERPAGEGNEFAIQFCRGETPGRHVRDALKRGYRLGIIGSGDTHDGRPGLSVPFLQTMPAAYNLTRVQGIVGIWAPELTREAVFDALWNRRVFATMNHRTILLFSINDAPMGSQITPDGELSIAVEAAADQPIRSLELVGPEGTVQKLEPKQATVQWRFTRPLPQDSTWYYIRLTRADGTLAWSSPIWVDPEKR